MKLEDGIEAAGLSAAERREIFRRSVGHLVSLNGVHGVIACDILHDMPGEYWSIGNLISIVHDQSRLVGVVVDMMTPDQSWKKEATNHALIRVELSGEIIDEAPGKPVFYRGISAFPALGSVAHRIRAGDLRAIYTMRGVEGVEIGRLTQNPTIPATVSIEELTKRHFAVVGSTGVGKTTSVSMLIKKCLQGRPEMRLLIIDPHNEYSAHFRDNAVVLDSENLDLPYWMFRFDEIVDVIYGGRRPNAEELDALYEVIRAAKVRFAAGAARQIDSPLRKQAPSEGGWVSADTPVPYRISDVVQILDEWMGKLDPRYARADLRTLKHRIEGLSRDPRYRFMFGRVMVEDTMTKVVGHVFRLPKHGRPVTIIQAMALPNEVVNSVVSVLSRMAFEVAMYAQGPYNILVVCEEAHRYIPADHTMSFEPTRKAIARIAKEGRKYGVSLAVVTQRPADLDATVLSQCSTMFSMRLANDRDKTIVASAVGAASTGPVTFLSSLADREAVAFGEAIATPMRMKFGDYKAFEADRMTWDPGVEEDGAVLRAELKSIVARMRGEYQPEGSATGR